MPRDALQFISILLVFIGQLLFFDVVYAGFSLPSHTYRLAELDNALEEAKANNKTITFLMSDENTRCPLSTQASLNIINEIGNNSILVYVEANNNVALTLPGVVLKAFNSSKAGMYVPKAVIANSRADRVIDIVPYKRSNEEHIELLRKANKKILISEQPGIRNTLMNIKILADKYRIPMIIVILILGFIILKK